jgi:hypothetical protein
MSFPPSQIYLNHSFTTSTSIYQQVLPHQHSSGFDLPTFQVKPSHLPLRPPSLPSKQAISHSLRPETTPCACSLALTLPAAPFCHLYSTPASSFRSLNSLRWLLDLQLISLRKSFSYHKHTSSRPTIDASIPHLHSIDLRRTSLNERHPTVGAATFGYTLDTTAKGPSHARMRC